MKNPSPDSKRSQRRINRGVSISSPFLKSRKHRRAERRMGDACTHAGPHEQTRILEPGATFKRAWNDHECRGGGSRKMW